MATSKLQEYTKTSLLKALSDYEVEIIENSRPYWLLSSDKLTKMELDLFIPKLNLAFEIQGEQHFKYIPYFHKDENDFKRRLMLDQEKKDLCYGKGIQLIEICCEMDIDLFIKDFQENKKPKEKIIYLNNNAEVIYIEKKKVIREVVEKIIYQPPPPKERLVKSIKDVTTDEILPDILCDYRKIKRTVEKVLEIQRYQRFYKRCCKDGKNDLSRFEFKFLNEKERNKLTNTIKQAYLDGGGIL